MKYRKIVEALDRMLDLIGKQGIYYQGTQQAAANSDTLWNPGNFLAIARQVTYWYLLLYVYIDLPLRKDVSYTSPKNQNELIGIIPKYIIQKLLFLQTKLIVYICMMCMFICVCISICVGVGVIFTCAYIYMFMKQWCGRLRVFLFSNKKLVRYKHLKTVASHLGVVFTCTLNHYYLFIQNIFLYDMWKQIERFCVYCVGVNILRWCLFLHLFGTPFQNSSYGHVVTSNCAFFKREEFTRKNTSLFMSLLYEFFKELCLTF